MAKLEDEPVSDNPRGHSSIWSHLLNAWGNTDSEDLDQLDGRLKVKAQKPQRRIQCRLGEGPKQPGGGVIYE